MAELPSLQEEFYSVYSLKQLEVLSVNLGEDIQRIIDTVEPFEITYPILLDREGKVNRDYKVRGIPLNIVIDKKGIIRYRQYGYNPSFIKDSIDKYLEGDN